MARRQAMIAAGLGCRKDCTRADLLSAVNAALARAGRTLAQIEALYIPEFKRDDAALQGLASELTKPLHTLPLAALKEVAPLALTSSARVRAAFGLPSVAETAALAGATLLASTYTCSCPALETEDHADRQPGCMDEHGKARAGEPVGRPILLQPRVVVGGATCALAVFSTAAFSTVEVP